MPTKQTTSGVLWSITALDIVIENQINISLADKHHRLWD